MFRFVILIIHKLLYERNEAIENSSLNVNDVIQLHLSNLITRISVQI
jgi:hypothetical protein